MQSRPAAKPADVRIVETMEEFESLSAKAMKSMLAERGQDVDSLPRGKKELRELLVIYLKNDSGHAHLARLLKERAQKAAPASSKGGKSRCAECGAECEKGMTDSSGTFLCMPCCACMLKRKGLGIQEKSTSLTPSSSHTASRKDTAAKTAPQNGTAAGDTGSVGGAGSKKRTAADAGLDEALRSALECPICIETMLPPILQCPAGHLICTVCRTKVSKCPTCRARLGSIRNLSLEKLVTDQHLTLACTFESRGCKSKFEYSKLTQHQLICKHRPFSCPHELTSAFLSDAHAFGAGRQSAAAGRCNWKGYESEIVAHLCSAHGAKFFLPLRACCPLPPPAADNGAAAGAGGSKHKHAAQQSAPKDAKAAAAREGAGGGTGREGIMYCIDSRIEGPNCTKSHSEYLQLREPGSKTPVTFKLEYMWSGQSNLSTHAPKVSRRSNAQVVAFVTLRLMGHADNSWFYTLRVGKDVQVSVATTSTKSTSTAEAGAKKDARAGKDGKHDGKDAKDGKGKGIGKSSDSYHANPQDPDAAADTTHRDFVCATHAPAAAGRGGLGCSWTGRVHGARVDMCDLQDVGEGLVVTGAQAMRLVGSIPSRKAAHISTSCSSASTRDDTSASSSSRSTSGDSHNKAGGGGGGSGAGGSAGDGAGAGSGPSSLQVVLSLSVWRDASAAASGQFEILPEYLLSLQRPLSSSGAYSSAPLLRPTGGGGGGHAPLLGALYDGGSFGSYMYSSRDVDGGSDSSDDGSEFNYSDFIESGDDDNGVSSSSSDSDSDISFTSADSSSSPSSSALPSVEDAYTDSNAYSST